MKLKGKGGGRTVTGLNFENKVDFRNLLEKIPGYQTQESKKSGYEIYYNNTLVARGFKQHGFYKFLTEHKVDWKKIISKKLLPDDALLVIVRETLFIIEVKYQQVPGSVDEKLQTCDFKRKQYQKLVASLGYKV